MLMMFGYLFVGAVNQALLGFGRTAPYLGAMQAAMRLSMMEMPLFIPYGWHRTNLGSLQPSAHPNPSSDS